MKTSARAPAPVAGLAGLIDQTVLLPLAAEEMARRFALAAEAGFAAFVTHASYLPFLKGLPKGCSTSLSAVVDFPFGLSPAREKIRRIHEAAGRGAKEIEMVINLADAASGKYALIGRELAAVEKASRGLVRKVIIESAYRDAVSMRILAELIAGEGFEFVKTSTGFASAGARVADIRLLAGCVGPYCRVKASGGIKSFRGCLAMLEAGAARIGTSRGLEILGEARKAAAANDDRLTAALMRFSGGSP